METIAEIIPDNIFAGVFRGMIELNNKANARVEGDYIGEDGFLYCGKCHTRKQFRLVDELQHIDELVGVACECKRRERDEEAARIKAAEAKLRIAELRRAGISDAAYSRNTFSLDDGSNPAITKMCKLFVEKWDEIRKTGSGIMFYGDVGTGKTFYACCIANALIDKGVPCIVTSIARLIDSGDISVVETAPLLVLDDIGAERDTSYGLERMFLAIDARNRSGKPLIATTNLTLAELANPTNMQYRRIYDRINGMCVPVKLSGESKRKEQAKRKRDELERILYG